MTFNAKHILGIMVFVIFGTANAAEVIQWQENKAIGTLFKKANITGTFVLYDISENKFIGHNQNRAQTRFIPASTF